MDLEENELKEKVSNFDYITWLKNFTLEYHWVSDENWLYRPEVVSYEDKKKSLELSYLYFGIDAWARQNLMYPKKVTIGERDGYYYNVQFDDAFFQVGLLNGDKMVCYAKRVEQLDKEDFINFYDVVSNKKRENLKQLHQYLQSLSEYIVLLHQNGVPTEAIANQVNTTIEVINLEQNETLQNDTEKTFNR